MNKWLEKLTQILPGFGVRDPDQVVALDIGSSKVLVVVAQRDEEGRLNLAGFGSTEAHGIREGAVVNIEEAVDSIRSAVNEAEAMAECLIRKVNVSLAGGHVQSLDSSGAVPVREGEITPALVDQVLDAASAVKLPHNKELLHVLPKEFGIDDQYGIRTPLGMAGVRLDVRVHLVAVGTSALHNLLKCTRLCGLDAERIVLGPLAASDAVLEPSERELGVCLIDMGGGTSDFVVYTNGAVQYTGSIPLGGNHVNRDIAVALGARVDDAEQVKIQYGQALFDTAEEDTMLAVPGLGERPDATVASSSLADVIRSRYEEIFEHIDAALREAGFRDQIQGAGVVLTGGAAMLRHLDALAEQCFGLPVRIGAPRQLLNSQDSRFQRPIYAAGIGLLGEGHAWQPERESSPKSSSWLSRVREWF